MTTTGATRTEPEIPKAIGASIDPGVIRHVDQFFDGSADDIAGATQIEFRTNDHGFEMIDDGVGIRDPRDLLRFGGTGWHDELQETEQPAGMGVYALAGSRALIVSKRAGREAWRVVLEPEHYRGERDAAVRRIDEEQTARQIRGWGGRESGTYLKVDLRQSNWHAPLRQDIAEAAARATEFAPLDATVDGAPVLRRDYCSTGEGCVYSRAAE